MPIKQTFKVPVGFLYLLRGLKLIFSDWRLLRLSVAPFIINTLLFIIFFLLFNTIAYYISSWVFEQSSQEWYWALISVVTGIALFVVSLLVVLFGFVAVGLVVSGPFNDLLSTAVESKLTGSVEEADMGFSQRAWLTLKTETRKMALFLTGEMALLALNFVPVVGQAMFVVLNPLFIAFVMAYEFSGYTLDRRGYDFAMKRKFVFSNGGLSLGFGAAVGLTLFMPLIHFMTMPAAVAGGTMLAVENISGDAGGSGSATIETVDT